MANYSIRNTRGQIIANVADTTLDTTTAVYLVGRNYSGYGIYLNDNSVRLMENFAANTAPSGPLEGQLWYDTGVDRMKWWDGVTWKQVQSTEVAGTNPTSIGRQDGDQWYDVAAEQLKIWNASPSGNVSLARWDTIGPQYTAGTPKSGVFVETIYDDGLVPHYVLVSYANGSIVTILNPDAEFTPTPANVIVGFDTIKRGLQMTANVGPYTFAGTTNNSIQLGSIDNSFYLRSNTAANFSNIAPVYITSNVGLTIGEATTANVRVDYSTGDLIVQNIGSGGKISLLSRSAANADVRALYIDSGNVILNDDPTGDLHAVTKRYVDVRVAATNQNTENNVTVLTSYITAANASISALQSNAATQQSQINLRATIDSPALTGTPTAPTPAIGDNDTSIATTAFVFEANAGVRAALLSNTAAIANDLVTNYAPLASPTLIGVPVAPTAAINANTTQISTTAFVSTAVDQLNSTVTSALSLKAPLASPALTGVPVAPTAAAGTNTTQLATTAFVFQANAGVLARVLANTGAVANDLATNYALKASPALTGIPTAPTASSSTNTTQISTTAFVGTAVDALNTAVTNALSLKAPLASPALTGNATAPTAAAGTNTTQLATTAFVFQANAGVLARVLANTGVIASDLATNYAPLASPALTGIPVAPTAAINANTTQISTTAFVSTAVGQLNNTVTASLSLKAPLASPALTGNATAPTAAAGTNTTQLATTAFVFQANAGVLARVLANTALIASDLATNYALKASPALTGIPVAPTASSSTNTTQIATTAFVGTAIDTLNTAVTNALSLKAPLTSPALTGNATAPTAAAGTNTTQLATTAFVFQANAGVLARVLANTALIASDLATNYALKASPALTGAPTAPTATTNTNTTQIATTAFVGTAVSNLNSNVTSALNLKAPLASPALTGVPTAPNASVNANTAQIATTSFVQTALAQLFSNTFANTGSIADSLNDYARLLSPTFTGTPLAPTASSSTNTTQIATTAFVGTAINSLNSNVNSALNLKAPLASPALTGTPTAPNASVSTDTTQLATTGFVHNILTAGMILMWSGSVANIPVGWALCNGSNGTPDLRNRFVVGAGSTYAVGDTGGQATANISSNVAGAHNHGGATGTHALTIGQMPSHTHLLLGNDRGTNTPQLTAPGLWPDDAEFAVTDIDTIANTGGSQGHSHTISTDGGHLHSITGTWLPPYYALCYIMKTTG